MARRGPAARMRDGYLRGALPSNATPAQMKALAAYVAAGGSVPDAAELVGIQPSTLKRHCADLRARSGLTTEQLISPVELGVASSSRAWSPTGSRGSIMETLSAWSPATETSRWEKMRQRSALMCVGLGTSAPVARARVHR